MRLLTKQEIMNARDILTEDVPTPEWAPEGTPPEEAATCGVRVRGMTGRERDAFEASLVVGEGKKSKRDLSNLRARLVGVCLVDDGGRRVFTDTEIQFLGAKSAAALDRVFSVAQRLSGLSAADVEDLEKKSAPAPNESSPSISA